MKIQETSQKPLDPNDPHDRRELVNAAEVCETTLKRALAGLPVKPLSMRRIRRVLAKAGLLHLLPAANAR